MDFVLYVLAPRRMTVDLRQQRATGEGSDILSSIESAIGSDHDDTLLGSAGRNYLIGGKGTDTVNGRGGGDQCYGEVVSRCPISPPLENQADPTGGTMLSRLWPASDPAPASTAMATSASRYSAGSVQCPALSSAALVSYPTIHGYGYVASRTWHPFTGYSAWTTSAWLFWDAANGWRYLWNGSWHAFDGNNQWFQGGVSIGVQVWYWSDTYQQWYNLGECITQGVHIMPGVTMVYEGQPGR
jgi:Ca2+-binding RTX toxin-like protein